MRTILEYVTLQRTRVKTLTRGEKIRFYSIFLMQIMIAGALLWSLYEAVWLTVFISALALVIVWLPSIIARNISVHLPIEFEFLLNVFIYSSLFLGEIRSFYELFWWWDMILHFSSGLALGFIGFLIMYSLYRGGKIHARPFVLSLFAFCFALSLGALWEIFEFTMDRVLGTVMQKPMLGDMSGLTDTVSDLILDTLGALVVSVSGFIYIKYRRPGFGVFSYFLSLYKHNHSQ